MRRRSGLLLNVEAIAYHEGVPGHHLQFSIAQEMTDLPPFRKFDMDVNAYTEGWAFYAERLGKEVGFYQDPYSEYGRLQNEMWRAVRWVVDTGVHSQHWTRQQMVDYFHEHTAMDDENINTEVDRYIAWPAQALSYKMGQMKILELRERAQRSWARSLISGRSTMPCSIPGRCRWMCWRERSMLGLKSSNHTASNESRKGQGFEEVPTF